MSYRSVGLKLARAAYHMSSNLGTTDMDCWGGLLLNLRNGKPEWDRLTGSAYEPTRWETMPWVVHDFSLSRSLSLSLSPSLSLCVYILHIFMCISVCSCKYVLLVSIVSLSVCLHIHLHANTCICICMCVCLSACVSSSMST